MSKSNSDELQIAIGRTIARQRLASGLTQDEVAERLGVGLEAVSRMERGKVVPTVARLFELAEVFQCDAADLLTDASIRPSDQASHLSRLLSKLTSSDREMMVEVIERLSARLARKQSEHGRR
ncbi:MULTISPECIES: helix-turn-helix domain-containing protein [Pandoraea]|uniref:helix-turn-helix domain-containing protein n=1 Tax=Pandoraea TaxID=93217 RepID=UPI001241FA84|nr:MULTISPECIES: helix-turn-helix transcriptional regulator [Pandoraea]